MRALKVTLALVGMLVLVQYAPVYYSSLEFNDFVQQEVMRARSAGQLKETVLNQARSYSLPVSESDINITTSGSVFRVNVDYSVPVKLLVYTPHLRFQAGGTGLQR